MIAGTSSERPAAAAGRDRTRLSVGIATRGRPTVVEAVVGQIARQTVRPDEVIVSCTSPGDVGALAGEPGVTILTGPPGLARQRIAILDHLGSDTDIVVFFDDDFVPHEGWIAAAMRAFRDDPRAACVTGRVVADGIKGPGILFADALAAVAKQGPPSDGKGPVVTGYSPYGCNMAFRLAAVGERRFDERLVLYGWLEDRDFGGALARDGWHLLKIEDACGVHMGVKAGRVAGRRLGYSQVVNPIYLNRKGTMALSDVLDHLFRNVTANLLGSFRPEPFVDRRGRLRGNMVAAMDVLRGRIAPERAESL